MSIAPGPSPVGLTPVAALALLTLQLRAASKEAEAAEAEEAALDLTAEQEAMRARLESIVGTRRAALEREMAIERAAADDLVRRAHVVAEQIRSDARARVQQYLKSRAVTTTARDDEPDAVPVADEIDPASTIESSASTDEPMPTTSTAEPIPAPVDAALGVALDVTPARESGAHVVSAMDAEAFARVFAAVLATVLDEKFTEWRAAGQGPSLLSPLAASDTAAAAPRSSWRGIMHLDILLMTIAAAILMVLLFAWLG